MASGWFEDPYGRHEARWISAGVPTSLVRDGTIERTDRATEALGPMPVVQPARAGVPRVLPTNGSNPKGSDRPAAGRQRLRGSWLMVFGLLAIAVGVHLVWPRTPPTYPHRFVPTPGDLAVLHGGGTAVPSSCSDSAVNSGMNDWGIAIGPESADTRFTIPVRTVVSADGGQNYSSEISASAPVCRLDSGDLYLERPGTFTVYFISAAAHVSVVRVVVTPPARPTVNLGKPLIVLGVLVFVAGAVLWYRRIKAWKPAADLRGADDEQRAEPFDQQKAKQAAFDAFDQGPPR